MFTDAQEILSLLKDAGFAPEDLTFISRGVMTDKYFFRHNGRKNIIRCFQPERANQPEIEYRYLELFQKRGIKAPRPVTCSCSTTVPFIVYEMLEGDTLSDSFNSLNSTARATICAEIADNYRKISAIHNDGYGRIKDYNHFSDRTWRSFIIRVIDKALGIACEDGNEAMADCCERMKAFAVELPEPAPSLIWSDFSSDNIIVGKDRHLSGFIDFEGLLSGDPTLGIGYFVAHETNSELTHAVMDSFRIPYDSELVDFYALIRWCRLMPYRNMPLPNGDRREPQAKFLAYAHDKIYSFGK